MSEGHVWVGDVRRASLAGVAAIFGSDIVVDCHRRLRGPYTGTGSLLRDLVPEVHVRDVATVQRHRIEILATAPELSDLIGTAPGTLTTEALGQERTRWFSRLRTRRVAHGIVDFLRAVAAARPSPIGPLTIALGSVDHADATDQEFCSIALHRLDPSLVRLIVCTGEPEPPQPLGDAITARCRRVAADDLLLGPTGGGDETLGLAAAFVAMDGTSDVDAERMAYRALDPPGRARLHEARAAELLATGETSWRLGAVPYHLGNGETPDTVGHEAYRFAMDHCMGAAYYDAGLELASTVLSSIDPVTDMPGYYWAQTQRADFLALLGRPEETEPVYYDLLSRTTNAYRHMILSYTLAMLYTRIYGPAHKDHIRARAHVNTAIALASQITDPETRAFHAVFMNNGKALVEMHLGNLDESLRLVSDGIDHLERELPAGSHALHRSVLRHNRGQVYAALGRHDEALADFTHIIEIDPNYPEYRFDRANLLSRMGRHHEALTDYEVAMGLGPPFPELHYNRGDLRVTLGDLDGAVSDFAYVLDLEPDFLEARVSLASVLLDQGRVGEAVDCARTGIDVTPREPRLHCALGLALLERRDLAGARVSFDRALELDPGLSAALVNRAVVAFEEGDFDAAVVDLTVALMVDPGNPDMLFNRGYAQEAAGRHAEAVIDYSHALKSPDADAAELLYRRSRCHAALGSTDLARADLDAHLAFGPSPYAAEIVRVG